MNTNSGQSRALRSIRLRSVDTVFFSLNRSCVSPSTVVYTRPLHSTRVSRFIANPGPSRCGGTFCAAPFTLPTHTRRLGPKRSPHAGVAPFLLLYSILSTTPGDHDWAIHYAQSCFACAFQDTISSPQTIEFLGALGQIQGIHPLPRRASLPAPKKREPSWFRAAGSALLGKASLHTLLLHRNGTEPGYPCIIHEESSREGKEVVR